MRVFRLLLLTVIVSGLGSVYGSAAFAQQMYNAPTQGIQLPSPSVTEVDDATAISTNPANIGFLDSWSFVYAAASMGDYSHMAGQGHGFYFAFPAGPFGFGIATELLLPHDYIQDWQGLDKRGRLSLSMSLNPSKGLGLGVAYRKSMRYDLGKDFRSVDLSLAVRPINHLSVAFTFTDTNTPQVTYGPLLYRDIPMPSRSEDAPRQFVSALTLRPFGDDRVAVGAELHYMHGNRKVYDLVNARYFSDTFNRTDLHAIASVMLTDGVSLRGRFVAEGIHTSEIDNAYYMDASLSIDSDRFPFGFVASPYYRLHPESHDGFEGLSMAVRFSGDVPSSIPLILAPAYIVPLNLDEALDTHGMAKLMARLERVRLDKSVDMLLLKPSAGGLTLTQAMSVRDEVLAINETGKKTLCYIEDADASAYLSCSAASEIWVNPAGGIRLSGLSTTAVYFKNLLDKIGVKADIVRIGQYKSAPEMFTETGPTEPSDEAFNRYMDSIYGKMVRALQSDRSFDSYEAARKAIEAGPFLSSEAMAYKMADRMVAADELESEFEKLFGTPIYIADEYGKKPLRSRTYLDSPAVAVLHIEGDIVDGESVNMPLFGVHTAGAKTL
ncbi:MAG: S49 family peptidase, partial [Deltaproteobacteria bacterium]|nr:S49 family peptidase [Deltaproteobacteria bacterium]